jgi:probable HAF family extracellular repeat protein
MPQPNTAAQPSTLSQQEASHYVVTALGTLGGSFAAGISVNDIGTITGLSLLPNGDAHAALWRARGTTATDLGTLGGANSGVEWPNHNLILVAGISQTSKPDPLGEQWSCSAFIGYTGNTCLGFAWGPGGMQPLPTLGGNNGFATGANAWGQIVGWAETTVHDPTCVAPQVLQFEAVLWDGERRAHALPPLPGDRDSAATAINDSGDVAGISGICQNAVGDLSAEHAVMWHNDVPTNIGNLGGAGWNTPMAINDRDEIVGFSDQTGDDGGNSPNSVAFLWTRSGGIVNLHALPGDTASQALGVNIQGTIVGISCPTVACATSRAFIYENGMMTDLNTLVPAGSPFLLYANDINDEGVITGLAVTASGEPVAFRAVPSYGSWQAQSSSQRSALAVTAQASMQKLGLHVGPFGRIVPKLP